MADDVQPIGRVTHFFDRISVAVVEMYAPLALGEWVHFYGVKTNFVQPVESIQINHEPVAEAYPDEEVAILVEAVVRRGDWMYPYLPPEA